MTPFTLESDETDQKLIRMGLAFTPKPLKPFNLETLSLLFWLIWSRSVWFQCKRAEPNGKEPEENGYEHERLLSLLYYCTSQMPKKTGFL